MANRYALPGWIVSKIFFLGFSCDIGSFSSYPSKKMRSPIEEPSGGWRSSIPPSLPAFDVAYAEHSIVSGRRLTIKQ
jgi:hypothetical protein